MPRNQQLEGVALPSYLANKGFIALFALLGLLHLGWGTYEWWWLFGVDRGDVAGAIVQFKARWTAPILITLGMSAATLSYMVLRAPLGAMVTCLWYLCIAVLCHLGLLYFDPVRDYKDFANWVPVVVLGILAYKIAKRHQLSKSQSLA